MIGCRKFGGGKGGAGSQGFVGEGRGPGGEGRKVQREYLLRAGRAYVVTQGTGSNKTNKTKDLTKQTKLRI